MEKTKTIKIKNLIGKLTINAGDMSVRDEAAKKVCLAFKKTFEDNPLVESVEMENIVEELIVKDISEKEANKIKEKVKKDLLECMANWVRESELIIKD
jgi:hypothetical protein